jgi:hypothetical protein
LNKPESKLMDIPPRYEKGFLAKLDNRTEIAKRLRVHYVAICDDLGGEENLSHIKLALIERFVFLQAVINKYESDMANNADGTVESMGKWGQAVNSLIGLAKTLGIERSASKNIWNVLNEPDEDEPQAPRVPKRPTPKKPKDRRNATPVSDPPEA